MICNYSVHKCLLGTFMKIPHFLGNQFFPSSQLYMDSRVYESIKMLPSSEQAQHLAHTRLLKRPISKEERKKNKE